MMKTYAILLILCAVLDGCSGSQNVSQSKSEAAALTELKQTSAYALAVAEAGKELDPSDPLIKQTALILFDAAKFFNTTEKDIANVAYYHAKKMRERGIDTNATALMKAGMKSIAQSGSSTDKPSLQTFNLFGAMIQTASKS
jgi:PBP1b-binding outer membrane lipoprotein LpoB